MKLKMIALFSLISASAFASNLDVRCTTQIMNVNGVAKDVHVGMSTDFQVHPAQYELNIYTKPANSPSRRSNPIPADPVSYTAHVSITSTAQDAYEIKSFDFYNGYTGSVRGNLFPSAASDPASSYVELNLVPYGNPALAIKGKFNCTAVADW